MPRNEYALLQALPMGKKMSLRQIEALEVRVNKGSSQEVILTIDLPLVEKLVQSGAVECQYNEIENTYVYRRRTSEEMIDWMNQKY